MLVINLKAIIMPSGTFLCANDKAKPFYIFWSYFRNIVKVDTLIMHRIFSLCLSQGFEQQILHVQPVFKLKRKMGGIN